MYGNDLIIRATTTKVPFRIVLIDLTRSANALIKLHGARGTAASLLAETSMASILLSSGLKYAGTVSLSMEFSGDISLVQADSTPMGLFRATISHEEITQLGDFDALLSPQLFKVRKLNERGKLVQESIVEAPSEKLGPNLAAYMLQSEQIQSGAGILSQLNAEHTQLKYSVAFLVEAFPGAEEIDLLQLDHNIRSLPEGLAGVYDGTQVHLTKLLDLIAGDYETEIIREIIPQHYCPCNKVRTLDSMSTLPQKDLLDLLTSKQDLEITCDFCRNRYLVTPQDLQEIIQNNENNPHSDAELG